MEMGWRYFLHFLTFALPLGAWFKSSAWRPRCERTWIGRDRARSRSMWKPWALPRRFDNRASPLMAPRSSPNSHHIWRMDPGWIGDRHFPNLSLGGDRGRARPWNLLNCWLLGFVLLGDNTCYHTYTASTSFWFESSNLETEVENDSQPFLKVFVKT